MSKGQAQEILVWAGLLKGLNEGAVARQAKAAWVCYRSALIELDQSQSAVHMPELAAYLMRKEAYWNGQTFKLAAINAYKLNEPWISCCYLRTSLASLESNPSADQDLIQELRRLNEDYSKRNASVYIQPVPLSAPEPEAVFQCEPIPFSIEPLYQVV